MKKLFIYGFGYTAKYLVDQFNDNFSKIVGYTRNKEVIINGNKYVELIDHSKISNYLINIQTYLNDQLDQQIYCHLQ